MEYHITTKGDKIKISDLTDEHLRNIIALYTKQSKEGVLVITSEPSPDGNTFEEIMIYGEQALQYFGMKYYTEELAKRIK